jgi:integrase
MPKKTAHPYLWIVERKEAGGARRSAYYRRDGQRIPIRAPDGSALLPKQPGFNDAYAAIAARFRKAETGRPAGSRSMSALIASYLASEAFADKAPATREQYRRIMGEIDRRIGDKSVPAIEAPHVLALRDAFGGKTTPRKANLAVAMMSILLEHARLRLGWVRDNAAIRPKKLRCGPGFLAWEEGEFRQFLVSPEVGEPIKRAALAAFYLGLRIGDLYKLPRSAYRSGFVTVTPEKTARSTRATVRIPVHPALAAALEATPPEALTLLTNNEGQPWTYDNIKHNMTKAVRAAGLRPGLSFHGLRKLCTASLAEAELTDAQIESVQPHADPKMTAYYRRSANQPRLAAAAIAAMPDIRLQSDPEA